MHVPSLPNCRASHAILNFDEFSSANTIHFVTTNDQSPHVRCTRKIVSLFLISLSFIFACSLYVRRFCWWVSTVPYLAENFRTCSSSFTSYMYINAWSKDMNDKINLEIEHSKKLNANWFVTFWTKITSLRLKAGETDVLMGAKHAHRYGSGSRRTGKRDYRARISVVIYINSFIAVQFRCGHFVFVGIAQTLTYAYTAN